MIDFIIRNCGYVGWLPLIKVTATGVELYRGSHATGPTLALDQAKAVWDNNGTGNIIEFKEKQANAF